MLKWLLEILNGAKWLLGAAFTAISIGFALYLKGRKDEKEVLKELQTHKDNKRLKNVLKADDSVRSDIRANGLYNSDGFRRD